MRGNAQIRSCHSNSVALRSQAGKPAPKMPCAHTGRGALSCVSDNVIAHAVRVWALMSIFLCTEKRKSGKHLVNVVTSMPIMMRFF